jgi:hypothetical protein
MSAIHQQVVAKAAGMTVDELSESLMYQQYLTEEQKQQYDRFKAAGQENIAQKLAAGKIDKEEIENALKSLDAQEKFNIALDKAKEAFTNIVDSGTLDKLVNSVKKLADSLQSISRIYDSVTFNGEQGAADVTASSTNIADLKNQLKTATEDEVKNLQDKISVETDNLQKVIADQDNIFTKGIIQAVTGIVTLGGLLDPLGLQAKVSDYYNKQAKVAENAQKQINIANDLKEPAKGALKQIEEPKKKLLQYDLPDRQVIQDGYSDSSDGPFEITNRYGQTAITAVGDKIAVSPNITKSPLGSSLDLSQMINAISDVKNAIDKTTIAAKNNNLTISPDINIVTQPIKPTIDTNPIPNPNTNFEPIIKPNISTPTLDLTPFINAFTSFKNEVITAMSRPQPSPTFVFEGNGAELGKFIGRQTETGTAQNISTGYTMP